MFFSRLLSTSLLPLLALATPAHDLERRNAHSSCLAIEAKISSSSKLISLLPTSGPEYEQDISHWFGTSTQQPTCVLQVGSDQDLAAAMKIIAHDKTPFALRAGGHASNPGFSSTKSVHISFSRMKQITLSPDKSRVTLGVGAAWEEIYKQLSPSGVNVVGGRVPGPAAGGFTLGGGFSWKTNQFGLTADTVESFNLVLPNATITTVDASKPDLFFALKGGGNRFGAVTSAVYKTHLQAPQVYAGFVVYQGDSVQKVVDATAKFTAENKDSKAQVITTLGGSATGAISGVLYFYDGPSKPASFAPFEGIIPTLDTRKVQSFSDFVSSIPRTATPNPRGTFNTMATTSLTPRFVNAVLEETNCYGKQMQAKGALTVSYDIEPFSPDFGKFDTKDAYPHAGSPLPLNLYFSWLNATDDAFWYAAMRNSVAKLKQIASEEGILVTEATAYPNYAITGTCSQDLFGAANAARLRSIRDQVDPGRVMDLTTGFVL